MTPQAYADLVLDLVSDKALHADEVEWAAARTTVSAAAARAGAPAELHGPLRAVVAVAGGPHSGLVAPGRRGPVDRRAVALPTARRVGRAAVLALPACDGDPRAAVRYARVGGKVLREVTDADAWVVDLRGNAGGSMWPMLAVAAPLLGGDGVVGAFVDSDGHRIPWWVRRRRVGAGRGRARARSRGPLRLSGLVAVLTDGRTASSGEAVAVAFRGRPGSTSYGAPTWGFSTGNETFRLPDGALLHLTTSRFADRDGVVHGGPVPVDVPADDPIAAALQGLGAAAR